MSNGVHEVIVGGVGGGPVCARWEIVSEVRVGGGHGGV